MKVSFLPYLLLPLTLTLSADWEPSALADPVFVGEIVSVTEGPTGMSEPPLRSWHMQVRVQTLLHGRLPDGEGEVLRLHYSYRGHDAPEISPGQVRVFEVHQLQSLRAVLSLPLAETVDVAGLRERWFPGWSRDAEGNWRSPWGDNRTPQPLPPGITLSVTPVPPAQEIQFTNPDGDGKFTLTLTNTTDAPVELAAVPVRGEEILWQEAILLHIDGQSYPLPGAGQSLVDTAPLILAPGQSVQTTLNALIEGPAWPRGGSRIALGFLVGDQARTLLFYYMSRHHDALRPGRQD